MTLFKRSFSSTSHCVITGSRLADAADAASCAGVGSGGVHSTAVDMGYPREQASTSFGGRAMLAITAGSALGAAPLLRLMEPASQTPITLVGVMHYNPRSIQNVRSAVDEENDAAALGAVCVELCDARWDAMVASRWRRGATLERVLFEDECQAAFEAAQAVGLSGVELVDQPIGTTIERISQLSRETLVDATSPAGWQRIGRDLSIGADELRLSSDGGGLTWRESFDLPLVVGAPLALLRYLVSSPPTATLLVGALITLDRVLDVIAVDESIIGLPERIAEVVLVLTLTAAMLRIALTALVVERNEALATNIQRAAAQGPVVAVLGLVHMNGVRRRLVETDGSRDASSVEATTQSLATQSPRDALASTKPSIAPTETLSTPLLLIDCAALGAYALGLSAFKSLALAGSDLASPGFDLAADLATFDGMATARYIGIENFGAACLVLGWVVGGVASGACNEEWRALSPSTQWQTLVQGWALAAPLACVVKYGVLSQTPLPSLGRSVQAIALESSLAGLSTQNVAADALGMLAVLLLWRQVLAQNPDLL